MVNGTPSFYFEDASTIEYGVDEVARGCILGRVYACAVVWKHPDDLKDASKTELPTLPKGIVIRDSKTMSKAQRERACQWILENALVTSVAHKDAEYIDTHNILQSAHDAMAEAIAGAQQELHKTHPPCAEVVEHILVDGNRFRPQHKSTIGHTCIVKGDSTYFTIACAAIVAKVSHDQYIRELCLTYPYLQTTYDVVHNMGYGTRKHLEGIRTFGISKFHRKSFKCCVNQQMRIDPGLDNII